MELNFPLILDGATGTELQKRGYGGGGCAEQWVLEHPDAIREIQRGYVRAGRRPGYYDHPKEDAILMTYYLQQEKL